MPSWCNLDLSRMLLLELNKSWIFQFPIYWQPSSQLPIYQVTTDPWFQIYRELDEGMTIPWNTGSWPKCHGDVHNLPCFRFVEHVGHPKSWFIISIVNLVEFNIKSWKISLFRERERVGSYPRYKPDNIWSFLLHRVRWTKRFVEEEMIKHPESFGWSVYSSLIGS